MKLIILIGCLFLGMNIPSSVAREILEKPSWLSSFKKSDQIRKLDQLMSDKNFKEFYQEMADAIKDVALSLDAPVTSQQMIEYLYLRYLTAIAPLIGTDDDENIKWMMDKDNLDLKTKSRILRLMSPEILERPDFKSTYSIPKAEAIDLYNDTQAVIINQFKKLFHPGMKTWKKEQILNYEKNSHLYPDRDSTFQYFNTVNIKLLRNTIIENGIKNREKYFVENLIKFYPKTAAKSIGLMEKAGYEKKEMSELIDRTAGRSKKTEYLHRILPKTNKQK